MVPAVARDGGGSCGIDRSGNNLHLKKELTQIRKAARVLKDPGTSSSLRRSPPPPPAVKKGGDGGNASKPILQVGTSTSSNNVNASSGKGNSKSDERERKVYLCNWRSEKSESGISRQNDEAEGSSSTRDSSSNFGFRGRNDSKSDGYFSDRIFKCMDSSFKPSIRRITKKRLKRSNYSSPSSLHRNEKTEMKMLLSRYMVDDDFLNNDDLGSDSAISHLLARIKNNGLPSHTKESDSLPTSSYNRYVESWVATTISLNNGNNNEVVDDELDLSRKGCGIPCCWSRGSTPKSRYGSSCSPSLYNTFSRRNYRVYLGSKKGRLKSNTSPQTLIPLITGGGEPSMRSRDSDDELSTNFSELDLEGLSQLNRRRWPSSCGSREGLELVEVDKEGLSHKYRPLCFEELIEQNLVVQSLKNAISRRRIAPIYLFHGPRGVGKSSTARIFAAALNCLGDEEIKPCGACKQCRDFISGKSAFLEEINGSNKKGVDRLRKLVNASEIHPRYKVIVVDNCQLLPSKKWLAFLRLLDSLPPFVVFILITTDVENVPRSVLTRCEKLVFNKISNGDIVTRLRKISIDEDLDVESKALESIASNADGSLRDAETMLDQLSLFDKRITKSLVNELMGVVVSEEKLVKLLELAMSPNATETVRKSREVIDSGVDPLVLISQLVSLIVDIIAGTYTEHSGSFFGGRALSERELEKLKHALTLLSEAEKHLRLSSERSTWLTATLLQIGSMPSPGRTHSTSSRRQTSKATENSDSPTSFILADRRDVTSKETQVGLAPKTDRGQFVDGKSLTQSNDGCITCLNSEMLTDIWLRCIENCRSKTLRLLLHSFGKLVSISQAKGGLIAEIAFEDSNTKTRAEGFLSSITNSFEVVLHTNVEIKTSLLNHSLDHDLDSREQSSTTSRKGSNTSRDHQKKGMEERESIIHEQRLGTLGSTSHLNEDALARGMKTLEGIARPISPSLLHDGTFGSSLTKDSLRYESGSGGRKNVCCCFKFSFGGRKNKI